jgi:hypothetical protein
VRQQRLLGRPTQARGGAGKRLGFDGPSARGKEEIGRQEQASKPLEAGKFFFFFLFFYICFLNHLNRFLNLN